MSTDQILAFGQLAWPPLLYVGTRVLRGVRRVEQRLELVDELAANDRAQWRVLAHHHGELETLKRRSA